MPRNYSNTLTSENYTEATLSGPFIPLRLITARTVQNLLDFSFTVYEHAATMLKVEETGPR